MDYQSGINPDWCVCPQLDLTHHTVCFHRSNETEGGSLGFLFPTGGEMRDLFSSHSAIKPLIPPDSPSQDVRRPLRETFSYLVPLLIYLPPPRLFAWLAAELTDCLDAWLPLSLDSHWQFTHTLRELHWDCVGERQLGCSGFWKSGNLCLISLSVCFWWTIRWEQRTSLDLSPPALTTDHHYCAASMTLHTWLVYGFGFIMAVILCFTQGKQHVF